MTPKIIFLNSSESKGNFQLPDIKSHRVFLINLFLGLVLVLAIDFSK